MPRCTFFKYRQRYACLDPDLDFGQVIQVGCEVGCFPCLSEPTDVQASTGVPDGHPNAPHRWMRPYLGAESRHADGIRHVIVAMTPVRLPRGETKFELAPCYILATGAELFGSDICDCNWLPFVDEDGFPAGCPDPDPPPQYYPTWPIHTCYVFRGHGWPPNHFVCTGLFVGHEPLIVPMGLATLKQAALARTSWCTSNVAVMLFGHTVFSQCNSVPGPYADDYFNPRWTNWDYCQVVASDAGFVQDDEAPDDHQAGIDCKNAVMAWAENDRQAGFSGVLHFDQLDSPRRNASPAANHNSLIAWWSRLWNRYVPPEDMPAWADLPVVTEFTQSFLAGSKLPVIAEYVIIGAELSMSMVLHRIKMRDPLVPLGQNEPPELTQSVFPLIRMVLEVWMGVRCRFAGSGPYELTRDWLAVPDTVPLTIQSSYSQPFPAVLPVYHDRVIIRDSLGRIFPPPPVVKWEGHLGFFSDPIVGDVFDYDWWASQAGRQIEHESEAVARGLDGLVVPSTVSHPDREMIRQIWNGGVQIRFPWSG